MTCWPPVVTRTSVGVDRHRPRRPDDLGQASAPSRRPVPSVGRVLQRARSVPSAAITREVRRRDPRPGTGAVSGQPARERDHLRPLASAPSCRASPRTSSRSASAEANSARVSLELGGLGGISPSGGGGLCRARRGGRLRVGSPGEVYGRRYRRRGEGTLRLYSHARNATERAWTTSSTLLTGRRRGRRGQRRSAHGCRSLVTGLRRRSANLGVDFDGHAVSAFVESPVVLVIAACPQRERASSPTAGSVKAIQSDCATLTLGVVGIALVGAVLAAAIAGRSSASTWWPGADRGSARRRC